MPGNFFGLHVGSLFVDEGSKNGMRSSLALRRRTLQLKEKSLLQSEGLSLSLFSLIFRVGYNLHRSMAPVIAEEEKDSVATHQYNPIEVVTWYLADPLGWAPLASLLTSNPHYANLQKLEVVEPCISEDETEEEVLEDAMHTIADFLKGSNTLKELVIFTQEKLEVTSTFGRHLEQTVKSHSLDHSSIEYKTKFLQIGNRKALALSGNRTPQEIRRRHFVLDGDLLRDMSQAGWTELAKHLASDRSIQILVLKDVADNRHLSLLVEKAANIPTLQTLKLVFTLGKNPPHNISFSGGLSTLLSKASSLKRLYFSNCLLNSQNTEPLVETLKKNKTVERLDFAVCQFESGTGRQFKDLVHDNKTLKHVELRYPSFGKNEQFLDE